MGRDARGLVFVFVFTLMLWPLSAHAPRGRKLTYIRFHHSLNVLTSHALIDAIDEIDVKDGACVTRAHMKTVIAAGIALFVLFGVMVVAMGFVS